VDPGNRHATRMRRSSMACSVTRQTVVGRNRQSPVGLPSSHTLRCLRRDDRRPFRRMSTLGPSSSAPSPCESQVPSSCSTGGAAPTGRRSASPSSTLSRLRRHLSPHRSAWRPRRRCPRHADRGGSEAAAHNASRPRRCVQPLRLVTRLLRHTLTGPMPPCVLTAETVVSPSVRAPLMSASRWGETA
jgi:hypothetical protein